MRSLIGEVCARRARVRLFGEVVIAVGRVIGSGPAYLSSERVARAKMAPAQRHRPGK